MSEAPRKNKALLTMRDLAAIEVQRSALTTENAAIEAAAAEPEPPTAEELEAAAREAAQQAAQEEAERRAREEALQQKIAAAEAARAAEQAKRKRTQAVVLTLAGALAGALLIAILAVVFRPPAVGPGEVRAMAVPVVAVQSPERELGFLAIPAPEPEVVPEAAPPPPRRERPTRPVRRPGPRPALDTGTLF